MKTLKISLITLGVILLFSIGSILIYFSFKGVEISKLSFSYAYHIINPIDTLGVTFPTDYTLMNLKGKVKFIRETTDYGYIREFSFNNNGLITEKKIITIDSNIKNTIVHKIYHYNKFNQYTAISMLKTPGENRINYYRFNPKYRQVWLSDKTGIEIYPSTVFEYDDSYKVKHFTHTWEPISTYWFSEVDSSLFTGYKFTPKRSRESFDYSFYHYGEKTNEFSISYNYYGDISNRINSTLFTKKDNKEVSLLSLVGCLKYRDIEIFKYKYDKLNNWIEKQAYSFNPRVGMRESPAITMREIIYY